MPVHAETPIRNPITTFRREGISSLVPELSTAARWTVATGTGLALVGGFTTLILSRMPRPSPVVEQPKSQPLITPRIEQAPIGRSLRLSSRTGTDIRSLMPTEASSIDWIDCSSIPEGAVTVITDSQIGNNRLSAPIKGSEKINPAIPRSEPLVVTDLLKIRNAVAETLWAVDPKTTTPNILPNINKLKETVFMRIYEIEKGIVEKDASLIGNIDQCDSRSITPTTTK